MSINTLGGKVTHRMKNGMVLDDVSTYLEDYDVPIDDAILDVWANFMFPNGVPENLRQQPDT